jgi:hypothetical protein
MQSYVLKLNAGQVRPFSLAANLFVYESSVATPDTGDRRIKIKPDSGAEMVLRPGQRFRLAPGEQATTWQVSAFDPAVVLDGVILIGSGEFDDSNTLNVMKLDASFANSVTVTNDAAHSLPVTIQGTVSPLQVTIQNPQIEIMNDTGNRIPVSLDPSQSFGVSAPVMAYTNAVNLNIPGASAGTLVTAAANVNGVIVEQVIVEAGSGNLLAKATVPTAAADGDFLGRLVSSASYTTRQKVPAGKGVHIWNLNAGAYNFYTLITFL